eukprot:scaffold6073_cov169-Amphora_coffeaeformis.AAC.1
MSQYFMAAKPKHPYFYLLAKYTITRLLSLDNVNAYDPAKLTGPGAVKMAMVHFMNKPNVQRLDRPDLKHENFQRLVAGTYRGMTNNATVTVVGTKEQQKMIYVIRDVILRRKKKKGSLVREHEHDAFSHNAQGGTDRIVSPLRVSTWRWRHNWKNICNGNKNDRRMKVIESLFGVLCGETRMQWWYKNVSGDTRRPSSGEAMDN